jgi:hypothetical protein
MRKDQMLPINMYEALMKMPDRSDKQYGLQDAGPIAHLAHTKDRIFDFYIYWITGLVDNLSLEDRMIPLSPMDILYWEKCIGGFKRELSTAFTVDWACLHGYAESPWSKVYEVGDKNYRWWKIVKMNPFFKLGPYGLWCIETNSKFLIEETVERTDQHSSFDLVFAKTDEVVILKKELQLFVT